MSQMHRIEGAEQAGIPILSATRRERPRLFAFLIALVFGLAGLMWIWGSDKALLALALPQDVAHTVEVWKGTGYVVVTSVILYVLVSRPLIRLVRAQGRETRARAEAQARTKELETVLDAVPVAVWIARDPECRVIEGNRVGREMLGQTEPVNLSLSAPSGDRPTGFTLRIGGKEVAAEDLPVQTAARTGRDVRDCEEELVFEDGRRAILLGNAVPLKDTTGRVTGAVGAFMDVTDRELARSMLRSSEERFRQLFDALPDPAWDWDIEHDQTTFSATWSDLLGHEPNSRNHERSMWEGLLHPEDRDRVLERLRRCTDGPEDAYEAEYRIRCRDGGYKWVLSRGRVVERAPGGQARRMIGAITDMTERQRAEDDLRLSEARYRTLIESAPEAIVVFDVATGRFTDCNQQAGRLFGLSPEALTGHGPVDLSPERQADGRPSAEAAADYIRQAIEGRQPQFEWTHRASDGREIPCEIRLAQVPDRVRVLIRGSITDITERKRAQQALADSEERLRIFIQSAPAGVAMLDRELRYVAYSRRWLTDYGLGEQDLTGRSHYDVFPEIDERWKEIHRRCLAGAAEGCDEDRFERANGSVDYLKWEIQPWRDSSGAVGGLVFFTEMITARKLAEDALRASEERYRLVLRATSDAMWDYEPATGRLQWGDNVETMFGVTIAEMGDRIDGWAARLHPDDHDRTLTSFNTAVARGDERWTEEYRFHKGDGSYAVVLDRAYMLRDGTGKVLRIIGAMTDVTERRHSEQLMAGQARTLELLVGGEPLDRVLEEITLILEDIEPDCRGSVLLLNADGRTARTAAAPSLPPEYNRAIDGVAIGANVGSCGTAMFEKRRVIVTDIATDPLWADYKDLALAHGLLACWSEPVIGAGGRVLGSLAMYYKQPRGPGERELDTIAWAARLAGLAIERRQAEDKLRKRETDLRDLLDAVPDLMFRMDRDGRYLEYHAPKPTDLLMPPDRFLGRLAWDVLPPERAAQCMTHVGRAIATGEPQLYEYQGIGSRGRRHWEVRVTRCAEEQVLLLIRDITERRSAERRLKESEQRLSLLVRQSPLGVIVWDLNFCVAEWNKAAEQIFGWPAPEALGREAEFILPESARSHVDAAWRALRENHGGSRSTNANVTRDGRTIYCEWYNAPLIDADGRVFAVASIVDDVTEQHLSKQRQQLMMAELDHRVKNNLAAVISLAEQSGRATTSFADFRESFLGRIRALSRLHNALAATRWQGANLGTMLRQTLEAFGQDATSQAVVTGPTVVLPARAAQAMGMALNELCTNAIKYGALSVPGGRIEARWAIRPADATADPQRSSNAGAPRPVLELLWAEHGGPPVSEPTRRGFGTELIEGAISYELGGSASLHFMPEGLRCRIRIEMPEDAEFDLREVQPGALDDLPS